MHKNSYLLAVLLLIPLSLQAELYKGVDEEGNVTFSDKETPNSEVIPMHMPTAIQMPKPVPVEKAPEEKTTDIEYTTFDIVQPVNDAAVRNNMGTITVSVSLTPELDKAAGHKISISLDGKVIISGTTSLTSQLNNVDRGSHTIQATVLNKKGKTIKTSNSVTVHLKRIGLTQVPHSFIHPENPEVIIFSGPGPQTVSFQPGPVFPQADP